MIHQIFASAKFCYIHFPFFASPKNEFFFFKESFFGVLQVCNTKKLNSFKNNIIILQVQNVYFFSRRLFFCLMSSQDEKMNTLKRKKNEKESILF